MKKAYQIFLVIFILLVLDFLFSIPPYIPSWHRNLQFITIVNYIIIAILFVISIVIIISTISKQQLKLNQWAKPAGFSVLMVALILGGALFTFLALTDDFLSSRKFVKKYSYKNADATVYIYDESFLDPRVSVKVRNGRWPIVSEVYTSGEGAFPDDIVFNEKNDCLIIKTNGDSLLIDSKQIMKY